MSLSFTDFLPLSFIFICTIFPDLLFFYPVEDRKSIIKNTIFMTGTDLEKDQTNENRRKERLYEKKGKSSQMNPIEEIRQNYEKPGSHRFFSDDTEWSRSFHI